MSFNKAKEYLESVGFADRAIEFDVSSATVELAAQALGCEPKMIAKTMGFMIDNDPILVVVAGNYKIDNAKYKHTFNVKAKMLKFEEVEEKIGHAVGGVCPFGINAGVKVFLDVSLKENEIVYPACGSSNSAVKLTIEELEKISQFKSWVDVCKLIEN